MIGKGKSGPRIFIQKDNRKTFLFPSGVDYHSWEHTYHKVIKTHLLLLKNFCNHCNILQMPFRTSQWTRHCNQHPYRRSVSSGSSNASVEMYMVLGSNDCAFASLVCSYGFCCRFLLGPYLWPFCSSCDALPAS